MPTQNQNQPIRFLHLSDIHFTAGKAWDADPILRALARFIAQEVKGGLIPDLVVITGDLAFAGTADEYRLARDWQDNQLWPALPDGFPRDRLLLVPGNHDVDRRRVGQGVRHIQDGLLATSSQDAIAGLLKDDGEREVALKRHAAYLDFHGDWLGEVQPLPWWWRRIEIDGTHLHVAGLDSTWLAWRLAAVVAEAIIASPRVGSESFDAHLVRGEVRLPSESASYASTATRWGRWRRWAFARRGFVGSIARSRTFRTRSWPRCRSSASRGGIRC